MINLLIPIRKGRADGSVHNRIKLGRRAGEPHSGHSQVRGQGQAALSSELESENVTGWIQVHSTLISYQVHKDEQSL